VPTIIFLDLASTPSFSASLSLPLFVPLLNLVSWQQRIQELSLSRQTIGINRMAVDPQGGSYVAVVFGISPLQTESFADAQPF